MGDLVILLDTYLQTCCMYTESYRQLSFGCVSPSNRFTRITHFAERLPLEGSAAAKTELAILLVYCKVIFLSSDRPFLCHGHALSAVLS